MNSGLRQPHGAAAMIPLLALVCIEATVAGLCAGVICVVGAVKLCLDTIEVVQRVTKAAKETPK